MPRERTIERKRLSPDESRAAALSAAHDILLADGPQAVTLKAVAAKVGRTHANLLHHFGSAAGLQKSLAEHLAVTICATIEEAVIASRAGQGTARFNDNIAPAGRFDGIVGTIYANDIGTVDIGNGLAQRDQEMWQALES